MDKETFGLAWNSFHGHLASIFHNLLTENSFSDVTLVTDDQTQFKAHKFVLTACSPILKNLLLHNAHPNPLLYLRGVGKQELQCILQFMYLGETKIEQDGIDSFLDIAREFQVRELAQENESHDDEMEVLDFDNPLIPQPVAQKSIQENYLEKSQKKTVEYELNKTELRRETELDEYEDRMISENKTNHKRSRTNLNCDQCEYEATRFDSLVRHQRNIHEGLKYSCSYCDYQASDKGNLQQHQKTIHEGIKYLCDQCHYQSRWSSSLNSHKRANHSDKGKLSNTITDTNGIVDSRHQCNQCSYKAKDLGNLERHTDSLHDGIKYVCDVCDYQAKSPKTIRYHRQLKHQLKDHKFDEKEYLMSGNPPKLMNELYKCNECGFAFKTTDGLMFHSRKNHEDARYSCDQCEYKTLDRRHIERHQDAKHKGLIHYCDQCDYKASTIDNLTRHQQANHEGVVFSCNQCDYQALHRSSLSRHRQSKHEGVSFLCDQCDFQAATRSDLKIHHRSKHDGVRFQCDECDYKSKWKKTLHKHKKALHSDLL